MKKILLFFVVGIFSLTFLAQSHALELTGSGRVGGATVFSAETLPVNSFAAGFHEEYFKNRSVSFSENNHFFGSQLFLSATPFKDFQIFLNRKSLTNNNSKQFSPLHSISFFQSEAGTLINLLSSKHHALAFEPTYVLFNGTGIKFFKTSSAALRLLNTFKTSFGEEKSPVKIHINLQYFMNRSRKALELFPFENFATQGLYGMSQYYSVNYGLGLEMDLPVFNYYVEYSLDQMLRSDISFFKNPNRLATGIKFHAAKNSPWMLHLGGEFGFASKRFELVSITPNAKGFVGLSYTGNSEKKQSFPVRQIKKLEEPKKIISDYPISPIEEKVESVEIEISAVVAEETKEKQTPVVRYAKPKTAHQTKYGVEAVEETKEAVIVEKTQPKKQGEIRTKEIKTAKRTKDIPSLKTERTLRRKSQNNEKEIFPELKNRNANEEAPNKDFLLHFR